MTAKRQRADRAGTRLPPLRRVVGTRRHPEHGFVEEVYECGHCRQPKSDIYGETNATRRRCWECLRTEAPQIAPSTLEEETLDHDDHHG